MLIDPVEVVLHAEEGIDAPVAAGQFQGDHAGREPGQAGASVPGDRPADHTEFGDLRDQFERELGAFPVIVDDRQHLGVDEASTRSRMSRSSSVSNSDNR